MNTNKGGTVKESSNDVEGYQSEKVLFQPNVHVFLQYSVTDKYALWLNFRTIDENSLHGMGKRIENASEGITLQIEKKEEKAGALNAYIYLIMDAHLNIQNGAYVSAVY